MSTPVDLLIYNAGARADGLSAGAAMMVDRAISLIAPLNPQFPKAPTLDLKDRDFEIDFPDGYSGDRFQAPPEPDPMPKPLPVPPAYSGSAPTLTAKPPASVDTPRPAELRAFTKVAPSMDTIVVPPAPVALDQFDFTPPVLRDIQVPDAPVVALPEFSAQRPETNLAVPSDFAERFRFDFADQNTSMRSALEGAIDAQLAKINPQFHTQMSAIEARLSQYLAGGSALRPEIEDAYFQRAADKASAEYQRTRDAAYAEGASRGFTIPGGAVFSAAARARQAAADNNARAALEMALKQAELEQQTLQFAVTQSSNLRQMVLNATMQWAGHLVQINGQALQYAQGVLQASVQLYETQVRIVQANVEIYRAEAQVYEYRLKSVLAVYDIYRAQVQALESQVNVDRARVEVFSTQANAYAAVANAYRAVIDGVAAKAQIEKLRVDAFGAEVQAYSAEVSAKTAEWNGYRAAMEVNAVKTQAYQAQVQAFGQEVSAYKAQVEASESQIRAVTATNEGTARAYAAAMEGYRALVAGRSAAVEAEIKNYMAGLDQYKAQAQAKEASLRLSYENTKARNETTLANYKAISDVALSQAQMDYKRMTDMAQVASHGAGVYGSMASSALAGMNSLASSMESKIL